MGMCTEAALTLATTWPPSDYSVYKARQAVYDLAGKPLFPTPRVGDLPYVLSNVYSFYFSLYIRYMWVPGPVGNIHRPGATLFSLLMLSRTRMRSEQVVAYAEVRADIEEWLAPLAQATLVCDCGRRHCHAHALAWACVPVHEDQPPSVERYDAVHNPQDHDGCIDELHRFDETTRGGSVPFPMCPTWPEA